MVSAATRSAVLILALIGYVVASPVGAPARAQGDVASPKTADESSLIPAAECYNVESEAGCRAPCKWDEYGCYFGDMDVAAPESALLTTSEATATASDVGCHTEPYMGFDYGSLTAHTVDMAFFSNPGSDLAASAVEDPVAQPTANFLYNMHSDTEGFFQYYCDGVVESDVDEADKLVSCLSALYKDNVDDTVHTVVPASYEYNVCTEHGYCTYQLYSASVADTLWETRLLFTLCCECRRVLCEEGSLSESFCLTYKGSALAAKDSKSAPATALNDVPCDQSFYTNAYLTIMEELYQPCLGGMTETQVPGATDEAGCATAFSSQHSRGDSFLYRLRDAVAEIAKLKALSDPVLAVSALDAVCVPSVDGTEGDLCNPYNFVGLDPDRNATGSCTMHPVPMLANFAFGASRPTMDIFSDLRFQHNTYLMALRMQKYVNLQHPVHDCGWEELIMPKAGNPDLVMVARNAEGSEGFNAKTCVVAVGGADEIAEFSSQYAAAQLTLTNSSDWFSVFCSAWARVQGWKGDDGGSFKQDLTLANEKGSLYEARGKRDRYYKQCHMVWSPLKQKYQATKYANYDAWVFVASALSNSSLCNEWVFTGYSTGGATASLWRLDVGQVLLAEVQTGENGWLDEYSDMVEDASQGNADSGYASVLLETDVDKLMSSNYLSHHHGDRVEHMMRGFYSAYCGSSATLCHLSTISGVPPFLDRPIDAHTASEALGEDVSACGAGKGPCSFEQAAGFAAQLPQAYPPRFKRCFGLAMPPKGDEQGVAGVVAEDATCECKGEAAGGLNFAGECGALPGAWEKAGVDESVRCNRPDVQEVVSFPKFAMQGMRGAEKFCGSSFAGFDDPLSVMTFGQRDSVAGLAPLSAGVGMVRRVMWYDSTIFMSPQLQSLECYGAPPVYPSMGNLDHWIDRQVVFLHHTYMGVSSQGVFADLGNMIKDTFCALPHTELRDAEDARKAVEVACTKSSACAKQGNSMAFAQLSCVTEYVPELYDENLNLKAEGTGGLWNVVAHAIFRMAMESPGGTYAVGWALGGGLESVYDSTSKISLALGKVPVLAKSYKRAWRKSNSTAQKYVATASDFRGGKDGNSQFSAGDEVKMFIGDDPKVCHMVGYEYMEQGMKKVPQEGPDIFKAVGKDFVKNTDEEVAFEKTQQWTKQCEPCFDNKDVIQKCENSCSRCWLEFGGTFPEYRPTSSSLKQRGRGFEALTYDKLKWDSVKNKPETIKIKYDKTVDEVVKECFNAIYVPIDKILASPFGLGEQNAKDLCALRFPTEAGGCSRTDALLTLILHTEELRPLLPGSIPDDPLADQAHGTFINRLLDDLTVIQPKGTLKGLSPGKRPVFAWTTTSEHLGGIPDKYTRTITDDQLVSKSGKGTFMSKYAYIANGNNGFTPDAHFWLPLWPFVRPHQAYAAFPQRYSIEMTPKNAKMYYKMAPSVPAPDVSAWTGRMGSAGPLPRAWLFPNMGAPVNEEYLIMPHNYAKTFCANKPDDPMCQTGQHFNAGERAMLHMYGAKLVDRSATMDGCYHQFSNKTIIPDYNCTGNVDYAGQQAPKSQIEKQLGDCIRDGVVGVTWTDLLTIPITVGFNSLKVPVEGVFFTIDEKKQAQKPQDASLLEVGEGEEEKGLHRPPFKNMAPVSSLVDMSDEEKACEDMADFQDEFGFTCEDWSGRNCMDANELGYDDKERLALLKSCPKACDRCSDASGLGISKPFHSAAEIVQYNKVCVFAESTNKAEEHSDVVKYTAKKNQMCCCASEDVFINARGTCPCLEEGMSLAFSGRTTGGDSILFCKGSGPGLRKQNQCVRTTSPEGVLVFVEHFFLFTTSFIFPMFARLSVEAVRMFSQQVFRFVDQGEGCPAGFVDSVAIQGEDGISTNFKTKKFCGESSHSCKELGIEGTPQCLFVTTLNAAFQLATGSNADEPACMEYCVQKSLFDFLAQSRHAIPTEAKCSYTPAFPFFAAGELIPYPDCDVPSCLNPALTASLPVHYDGERKEFGTDKFFDSKTFLPAASGPAASSLLQVGDKSDAPADPRAPTEAEIMEGLRLGAAHAASSGLWTRPDAHGNFGDSYMSNPIALGTSPEAKAAYARLSAPRLTPAQMSEQRPDLMNGNTATSTHRMQRILEYERELAQDENILSSFGDEMRNKFLPGWQETVNGIVQKSRQLDFDTPDVMAAAATRALSSLASKAVRRRALDVTTELQFNAELGAVRDQHGLHALPIEKARSIAEELVPSVMAQELGNRESALGGLWAKGDAKVVASRVLKAFDNFQSEGLMARVDKASSLRAQAKQNLELLQQAKTERQSAETKLQRFVGGGKDFMNMPQAARNRVEEAQAEVKKAERKVRELEEEKVGSKAETLELVAEEQEDLYMKKMQRIAFLLNSRVTQRVQKMVHGLKLNALSSPTPLTALVAQGRVALHTENARVTAVLEEMREQTGLYKRTQEAKIKAASSKKLLFVQTAGEQQKGFETRASRLEEVVKYVNSQASGASPAKAAHLAKWRSRVQAELDAVRVAREEVRGNLNYLKTAEGYSSCGGLTFDAIRATCQLGHEAGRPYECPMCHQVVADTAFHEFYDRVVGKTVLLGALRVPELLRKEVPRGNEESQVSFRAAGATGTACPQDVHRAYTMFAGVFEKKAPGLFAQFANELRGELGAAYGVDIFDETSAACHVGGEDTAAVFAAKSWEVQTSAMTAERHTSTIAAEEVCTMECAMVPVSHACQADSACQACDMCVSATAAQKADVSVADILDGSREEMIAPTSLLQTSADDRALVYSEGNAYSFLGWFNTLNVTLDKDSTGMDHYKNCYSFRALALKTVRNLGFQLLNGAFVYNFWSTVASGMARNVDSDPEIAAAVQLSCRMLGPLYKYSSYMLDFLDFATFLPSYRTASGEEYPGDQGKRAKAYAKALFSSAGGSGIGALCGAMRETTALASTNTIGLGFSGASHLEDTAAALDGAEHEAEESRFLAGQNERHGRRTAHQAEMSQEAAEAFGGVLLRSVDWHAVERDANKVGRALGALRQATDPVRRQLGAEGDVSPALFSELMRAQEDMLDVVTEALDGMEHTMGQARTAANSVLKA